MNELARFLNAIEQGDSGVAEQSEIRRSDSLRKQANLTRIGFHAPGQAAEEFWADYDRTCGKPASRPADSK